MLRSEDFRDRSPDAIFATQSGPMLVIDGDLHPALIEGSSDRTWRTGVGLSSDGQVHFAISQRHVNFHDFARLFRDELSCDNALFLDGWARHWPLCARAWPQRFLLAWRVRADHRRGGALGARNALCRAPVLDQAQNAGGVDVMEKGAPDLLPVEAHGVEDDLLVDFCCFSSSAIGAHFTTLFGLSVKAASFSPMASQWVRRSRSRSSLAWLRNCGPESSGISRLIQDAVDDLDHHGSYPVGLARTVLGDARARIDRQIAQAIEPYLPFRQIDADDEDVVVEEFGIAHAHAGAQIAVERGLGHVAGARLDENARAPRGCRSAPIAKPPPSPK